MFNMELKIKVTVLIDKDLLIQVTSFPVTHKKIT